MAALPGSSGKTTLDGLSSLPCGSYDEQDGLSHIREASLYAPRIDGLRYDLLWSPKPGADRLFVLFSGDAMRSKNDPPVFQRWSWARHYPGHCLYISDPALHLDARLGLAWYAGTVDHDPMPRIARLVRRIAAQTGVAPERIISYGSSGGGFAALRFALHLPEAGAVAINPQTVVTRYVHGQTYLRVCLGAASREDAFARFEDRLSLLAHAPDLARRRIVYIQNTLDTHHFEDHYKPFCAALGAGDGACEDRGPFWRLLFAHEGGHKKAETQEVFDKAMAIVRSFG